MRTKDEIIEELFMMLDNLAYTGAMLPSELKDLENLKIEFYAQCVEEE